MNPGPLACAVTLAPCLCQSPSCLTSRMQLPHSFAAHASPAPALTQPLLISCFFSAGEQKLYFLAADGSNECAVPLPKVGLWATCCACCMLTVAAPHPSARLHAAAQQHTPSRLHFILLCAMGRLQQPGHSQRCLCCMHRLLSCPCCAACLPQEGPIHDVQWNSKGDYFVVGECQVLCCG